MTVSTARSIDGWAAFAGSVSWSVDRRAFFLAQFAYGGIVSQAGFTLLAVMWVFTLIMAIWTIRQRDVSAHRNWMVRNYALTFAAVTLRLLLVIIDLAGMPFSEGYKFVAWASGVPNALVAEILIRDRREPAVSRLIVPNWWHHRRSTL